MLFYPEEVVFMSEALRCKGQGKGMVLASYTVLPSSAGHDV